MHVLHLKQSIQPVPGKFLSIFYIWFVEPSADEASCARCLLLTQGRYRERILGKYRPSRRFSFTLQRLLDTHTAPGLISLQLVGRDGIGRAIAS